MALLGREKLRIGRFGEERAAEFLGRRGYQITAMNYRTKLGEIDIIARYLDQVHFVEVKTRTTQLYGLPCEAVGSSKQATIRRVADYFMEDRGRQYFDDLDICFDILEVYIHPDDTYSIRYLPQCF